ncbi:aminotransferase class I and II (plasmid) [Xanthobacter versatilis]|uniref:threonine-phosphate decarboxylase n=1 Tax=Xanthobacter autotrophicus (strain ATCC BAA-1158 / Py2) TaxID=78245 RepID=A7IQC7_XANP2|nr:aminotransferase class I and II [Xanthobacter autotrophicus Py2]
MLSAAAPELSSPGGKIYHGGDLVSARILFPAAPEPWLDLSTGINPEAYPVGSLASSAWSRLPAPADREVLERTAAAAYGVTLPATIVAAPGTQALLQLLPRLILARRVAILGFTYQEHAACWRAAGASVRVVTDIEDLCAGDVDAAVVVNPNNPDGRIVAAADLLGVARSLSARGGTLIVDEAFMDVVRPSASLVPSLPGSGVIVLRSFGKTYGLAGLRLGFAVAGSDLAGHLRAMMGPWAVSGPAISVGARALADQDWLHGTIARLEAATARLDELVTAAGLEVLGGTSLFRLTSSPRAAGWFARLGRAGILVRPFPAQPGWLRFGIPGSDEAAWARLSHALAAGA